MNSTSPIERCAIYCRISLDASGEEAGVKRQEEDCRTLAERLKLEVVEVYTDNDIGASTRSRAKNRPAYERMLADAKAGKFSTIVAYSNSRLTRRPAEWLKLIELANSGSVQIKTVVSGTHDLSTADGRAVAMTIAVWDGAEAERTSERLKSAHRHRAQQGKVWKGGKRPFGYLDDHLTPDPVEAPILVDGIEQVLGGTPVHAVAKQWNAAGVRSPANGTWSYQAVYLVLTNPRNCGWVTYQKELVRTPEGDPVIGEWQPIITPEQHMALMGVLAKRRKPKRRFSKYLLTPFMKCGKCGQNMWAGMSKDVPYYKCATGHLQITAEIADRWVKDALFVHLNECKGPTPVDLSLPIEAWQGEPRLAEVTKLIDDYKAALRAGRLSLNLVMDELDLLDKEKEALIDAREAFQQEKLAERAPLLVDQLPANVDWEGGQIEWLHENTDEIRDSYDFDGWTVQLSRHCRLITVAPYQGPHTVVGDRLTIVWDDMTKVVPPPKEDDGWRKNAPRAPKRLGEVVKMLEANPDLTATEVAEKLNVGKTYSYRLLNLASQRLDDRSSYEVSRTIVDRDAAEEAIETLKRHGEQA